MKLSRRTAIVLAVTGGLLGVLVLLDVGTASPRVCSSCHEIQSRAHSWSRSSHETVACVKCHTPVRAWYAMPLRVGDRIGLLTRDVVAHRRGGYPSQIETRTPGTPPISDAVCLQCHDPNRKATSGFRIKIDHAEHAKRNGSCVSCHVRTAHPIPERSRAMSLMTQCFTCHGLQPSAKAPGTCATCHPAGYALKPVSHTAGKWSTGHGKVAKADPAQCTMCHQKTLCTNCHGLEMPHPAGWERGRTGHGRVAALDRSLCKRCHSGGPDMCTMCHHKGYSPDAGPWVKQHFKRVRAEGLGECVKCHSPVFCIGCHAERPGATQ